MFFVAFFAPAEFGKLMASGDALVESVPAFLGPHNLWEQTMLLGYPLFADPNQQYWYPLAWLHFLPHTFNAFAVTPFVLAASGMAAFVRSLTRSTQAGVVAGLIYALGGFMVSHAGHLMLTHPAAWAPFVLWSIESMRQRADGVPIVACAVALGLCGVAGQPQILVFTATLSFAYVLISASSASTGKRAFILRATFAFVLGLALAGIQLIPEAVLAQSSTRAALAFDAFTSFEIPADQLAARAVFPYLLGFSTFPQYPLSRLDLGMFTEETVTVGLVSLALALLALWSLRADHRVAFWYAVACVALVLAVGDATPLAFIMHGLPIYGLFRAPGRHAFEFSFAIAVLAGYGSAALWHGRARLAQVALAATGVAGIAAFAYAQLVIGGSPIRQQIAEAYGTDAARVVSSLANGAISVPLATGLFGLVLFCFVTRIPQSKAAVALIVLAVAVDVGTFGWSAYWNWAAASARDLLPAPWVVSLGVRARATHTRIGWLPGALGGPMPPNLSSLWNVPVIGGYTPLVPRRIEALLGITAAGGTAAPDIADPGLDLAGTSVVASIADVVSPVTAAQPFANADLQTFIGSPRDSATSSAVFGLPMPFSATRVGMVSQLGDALMIPDKAAIGELETVDVLGHSERQAIIAGRDTAEFAYDRADVRSHVRHRRARIFSGNETTHRYVTYFRVAMRLPIVRVGLRWTYPGTSAGALTIDRLSLIDDRRAQANPFGTFAAFYAAPNHWRPLTIDPSIIAFENLKVMPRAWFAKPIVERDMTAAEQAIRSGVRTNGARFDARREAIVEANDPGVSSPNVTDRAQITEDSPKRQSFSVACNHACFLVVRDAFDSQWRVTVDEKPATSIPTDVALRGVAVPGGVHRVRFTFVPTSLYAGIAVTVTAMLLSIAVIVRSRLFGLRIESTVREAKELGRFIT